MGIESILIIYVGIGAYVILLLVSFRYSCGGWDKSCGLCWVGIVQAPLILADVVYGKIKKRKEQPK